MNNPADSSQSLEEQIPIVIRPSILPLLVSFDNIVLIFFLAVAAIFGTYLRLGTLEILIILIIGLIVLLPPIFRAVQMSKEIYRLDEAHLTISRNTKNKKTTKLAVDKIKKVRSKRVFFDRFLGTGNIYLRVDGHKREIRMMNVPNCIKIVKQIKRTARIK